MAETVLTPPTRPGPSSPPPTPPKDFVRQDDHSDVFYTPCSSPATSRSSLTSPALRPARPRPHLPAANSQPARLPPPRVAVPSTRTPLHPPATSSPVVALNKTKATARVHATASMASSSSSVSSNSLEGHSVVFSDIVTETTQATTPSFGSNRGASTHNKQRTPVVSDATKRWADNIAGDTLKATTTPMYPYTRRRPDGNHVIAITTQTNSSTSTNPTLHNHYQYQRTRDDKSSALMMSMTAVLEAAKLCEKDHPDTGKIIDEISPRAGKGASVDTKGKAKRADTSTATSSKNVYQAKGKEREHISPIYTRHQPLTSSPLAMSAKPSSAPNAAALPRNSSFTDVPKLLARPVLGHRRSRSLGPESMPKYPSLESPSSSPSLASHKKQDVTTPHTGDHPRVYSVSHSRRSSPTGTEIVNSSAHPHSSGELPSKGTPGFTSLVLPRAPPPFNPDGDTTTRSHGGLLSRPGDGKVDLTKDGLAQTTMASVEVVRGLGGMASKKGLRDRLTSVRRTTNPTAGEVRIADNEHKEPAITDVDGATSVLGFTSHRKPPEYVPNGSVLVQVWAVGIDGIDGRLIGVRLVSGGIANLPSSAVTTSNFGDGQNGQRMDGPEVEVKPEMQAVKPISKVSGLGRNLSLRERFSRSVSLGRSMRTKLHRRECSPDKYSTPQRTTTLPEKQMLLGSARALIPGIGHVPGRSFVGRVVECGWEVRDEVVRKGDWVAGLLDIKKSGALTEFIVVDRHRIHRVPHPKLSSTTDERALSALIFSSGSSTPSFPQHTLTLEELALLPLCGVPAYRAVRTFIYAFSSMRENPTISSIVRSSEMAKYRLAGHDPNTPLNFTTYGATVSRLNLGDHENGRRRRALVLRGHDGVGAMAVQMLVLRGWRVCVHVPFIASPPNVPTTSTIADTFMEEVEERTRNWGAEEVIFDDGEVVDMDEGRGAVVRVIDGLREDGDVFDVVLDTIGGKDVREAAERLLRSPGRRNYPDENDTRGATRSGTTIRGMGQFTTVIGDNPERAIPSAGDLFRAGIRSLKFGNGSTSSSFSPLEKVSVENVNARIKGKVGYAWVNISQDVDWEGKDIGETIGLLVDLGLEYGIKPWVGAEYTTADGSKPNNRRGTREPSSSPYPEIGNEVGCGHWEGKRIVPLEKAPDVFVCGGPLTSGGTVIVRIAT